LRIKKVSPYLWKDVSEDFPFITHAVVLYDVSSG
jgi:hypothetical protein